MELVDVQPLFVHNDKNISQEETKFTAIPLEGTELTCNSKHSLHLDVTQLRQHRLELSDLFVMSSKPLAFGAYWGSLAW
ncbi:hypothetical protein THRCLA_22536 [Thraustotheca clavata]|uniref:Uncharacterized protein n=1 Tax=Thraustotheca clavata TaxID=74557 RepID=A0A1V9YYD8_9STRA|nr:hypothetical protein THRCLA_22536 [Thraustotheca clavata]